MGRAMNLFPFPLFPSLISNGSSEGNPQGVSCRIDRVVMAMDRCGPLSFDLLSKKAKVRGTKRGRDGGKAKSSL